MRRLRRILIGLMVFIAALGFCFYGLGSGLFGRHEGPGVIRGSRIPAEVGAKRAAAEAQAAKAVGAPAAKQILFGDLHVHTTFSPDAYITSLPMLQGEGAHPPADACDYARYCSALDFWSINDHAEGITPEHWRETIESIRQCNATAGDATDPDLVSFLGWEWTQVGQTPEDHYGHKNVVMRFTDDANIPARPIASGGQTARALTPVPFTARALLALFGGDRRYMDLARYLEEIRSTPRCPDDVPVRDLPLDCIENATTPAELFSKLDDWGFDSIVIPHGTTWGFYTPPGSKWDKQLNAKQHDPDRQTLIEIFSGHGNSEQFRDWDAVDIGPDGKARCPAPRASYLPSCWRAGQIVGGWCRKAGLDEKTCAEREAVARDLYVAEGLAGHMTVPGAEATDWLDSGQCRDCFLPAFNFRPGGAVQYIMALTNFDDPQNPMRFRFGFIGSSDNHQARPGTGYKERNRHQVTEAAGPVDKEWRDRLAPPRPSPQPYAAQPEGLDEAPLFLRLETERQASFFMTGGLMAVHSPGRNRDAIWGALGKREVYATSGERILLWFDLLNPPEGSGPAPMGSEVRLGTTPRFSVRAAGAFQQLPGCPDFAVDALGQERLDQLCRGECFNPSDERKPIRRIEIVRIRPQARPGEPVASLVEDPWKVLPCPGDAAGCSVEFEDPDFGGAGRDTLYYARAIQAPSPAINASNLRCERDASGACVKVAPCYGDYRTPYDEDCLAETEERAWSSPIFVNFAKGAIETPSAQAPPA